MRNGLALWLGIVLTTMLVQSCKVTKDYQTPDVVSDLSYRTDSVMSASNSMAQIHWKDFFDDEQLQSYIELALANNFDLSMATKRIEQANSYFMQGKAAWWPSVTAGPKINHQEFSKNSQFGQLGSTSITQYEFSASTSWEADLWGKIRSQERVGEVSYLQSIAARQTIQTGLVSQIANTYFQILASDARKRIIEETIGLRNENLETLVALKDAGMTTSLAVNQARVQIGESQALLEDVKNQIYILENTLMLLVGTPLDQVPRATLSDQNMTTNLTLGVPADLLANRPDVQSAELELRYFFEQQNIAVASLYPSLNISATLGFQGLKPSNWFDLSSIFASIAGGLTQPVLQNRKLKTQVEVTTSQAEERVIAFQQALFDATIEVSDAMKDYETQVEKFTIRDEQQRILEIALENAGELLKAGLANYLEILSVQESILNVQLQGVETESLRLQAVTNIYRALGGGAN